MKFADVLAKFSKIKQFQVRTYAGVYKLENGYGVYTDGMGILKVNITDIPEDRQGKVFQPNGLDSPVKYPNVTQFFTNDYKTAHTLDIDLLNHALKYLKPDSGLCLNEHGINLKQGLSLGTLCKLWAMVKDNRSGVSEVNVKDGMYQVMFTNGVTIYVMETVEQS